MRVIRVVGLIAALILSLLFLDSAASSAQTEPPPPPAPLGTTLEALLEKADAQGSIPVIVGLRTGRTFKPEGAMATAAERGSQRESIASTQVSLIKSLATTNARVISSYKHFPYMALSLDRPALEKLIESGLVTSIQEDIPAQATMTAETSLIRANSLWANGEDGDGWIVVVLDTGIDEDHPYFGSRIIQDQQACFSNANGGIPSALGVSLCPNHSLNRQFGPGAADMATSGCYAGQCNHGTHVAGIAAGSASGVLGAPGNGVAPHARILPIQVFTKLQAGSPYCAGGCTLTFISDYVAALDYVHDIVADGGIPGYQIAAVNLSISGGPLYPLTVTPFSTNCDTDQSATKAAIDTLLLDGIPTVIAAGNDGSTNQVGVPGCVTSAITVGATTTGDTIADFSNRNGALLDLFAPGVSVGSSFPDNAWGPNSGTSMAAPMVAGGFAAIREGSPSASVPQILAALKSTGMPVSVGGTPISRVDLLAAQNNLKGTNNPPRVPYSPSPMSGASPVNTGTMLVWSGGDVDAGSTVTYDVYYGTSSPPSTLLCDDIGTAMCFQSVFDPATTYYWRVVARDNHNAVTNGPIWTLTTTGGTSVPPNDLIGNALVITGSNYTHSQVIAGATSASSAPLDPVMPGSCFNTTPTPPDSAKFDTVWYSVTPAANSTLTADTFGSGTDTVLAVWSGSPGSLSMLACNDDTGGINSLVAGVSLNGGSTYYIEVANFSLDSLGTATLNVALTIPNASPNMPSGPTPSSGATGVALNPTLSWSGGDPDPGDTVRYDVYFGTANPPTTKICSAVTAESCTPAGSLTSNTVYRWRVIATDEHAGTASGPVWSFTALNHLPSAPTNPSPADLATGVSTTPTLTWTASTDEDGDDITYRVYVDTSTNPTTLVGTCNGLTLATCNISTALNGGTLYRWKVAATDEHGGTTNGPVWRFTTINTPPNAPSSPAPANSATGVSLNPTLTWTGGDPDPGNTVTYKVYFGTANPPTALVATCDGISATSCTPPGSLADNDAAYWQVVATDNLGDSTSGPVWSFTALNHAPGAASTPSPADAATEISRTPTLTWAAIDADQGDTLTYDVLLDTGAASTPLAECTGISTPSCTPSATLADDETYQWTVVVHDNHGASTSGLMWSFTTLNHAPNTPATPSPADNAINVSTLPALTWTGGDPDQNDAASYDVYIGTVTPDTLLAECTGLTSASCTPGAPLAGLTAYTWKVIATDEHGASSEGPVWHFTTRNNPPNTPASPSPAMDASAVSPSTGFSWTGGDPDPGDTVTYDVYVDTKSSAAALACADVAIASCTLPGSLPFGVKIYWKVVATDSHGAAKTGPVWRFTTAAPPPLPSSPKNGSATTRMLPKLGWKSVKGATEYELQIDTVETFDSGGSGPYFDKAGIAKATYTLTGADPALNYTQYFWRVRAKVGGAWTAYSLPFRFDLMLNVSPKRGMQISTHLPKFSWAGVGGATGYDLEIFRDDPECDDPALISRTNVMARAYQIAPTDPALDFGMYAWRVRASQGTTTTSFGPCTPFTVSSLKTPKNNAAISTLLPKFGWGANKLATDYTLDVSALPDGETMPQALFTRSGLVGASYVSLPGDFPGFGRYVWSVTEEGTGAASTPFFTLYLTVMSKPANGAFTVDNTPAFSWKPAPDATSYTLEIALLSDPTFSAPIRSYPGLIKRSFSPPLADGLPQGTYLWRIVTVGGPGHVMPGWAVTIGP